MTTVTLKDLLADKTFADVPLADFGRGPWPKDAFFFLMLFLLYCKNSIFANDDPMEMTTCV